MHADKTNRFLLTIFSLLVIVAGAAGLLAGFGVFGSATRHRGLTHNQTGEFFGRHGDWLWPAIAVVVLVLVLLALRWLLALLFSTDRTGDLSYRNDGEIRGKTSLSDVALASAVAGEIRSYRGVNTARARVTGDTAQPALLVDVTLEQTADLAGLRNRIESQALAHARQATGKPELPIRLDVGVTTKRATRTR